MMLRKLLPLCLPVLLAACAGPRTVGTAPAPVTVGVIAINDFHGNLEEPAGTLALPDGKGGVRHVKAGGVARLASAVRTARAHYQHSLTVSAGDLIGASPLISSLYLDEPAIGAMNRLGLDFNAVGNHEFDRGQAELLRMAHGGCARLAARQPCALEAFKGARFGFLSASTYTHDGHTLFPATALRRLGKGRNAVTVGLIGLTLAGTSSLVPAVGIAGLTFGDEAAAINAAVPRLRKAGADAVIVLIHQGGEASATIDPNACDGLDGAIMPIIARLSPGVDLVVSGHTHKAYVCDLAGGLLLTSAGSFGRMLTEIELVIDPKGKRVLSHKAINHAVETDTVPPEPEIAAYVARYAQAVNGVAARPIGKLSGPASRGADGVGMGGSLGNLVADAQLAATRGAGAQIALTNPFGLRAPIEPAADGTVTFAQIYAAQPFANMLITRTFTGAQIKAVLEQGVDDAGPVQLLAASAGLSFCVDPARSAGGRITALTLDGQPLRPDQSYRVTTNSFLAGGGDGFTTLREGTASSTGGIDLDALEAWIAAVPVREVPNGARVGAACRD